ncbi:tail protein X [Persephonella sp.]
MEYTAKAGDRWDTIAYRFLGDAKKTGLLVEKNPHLNVLEFSGGERIYIPDVIEEKPKEVETLPWL